MVWVTSLFGSIFGKNFSKNGNKNWTERKSHCWLSVTDDDVVGDKSISTWVEGDSKGQKNRIDE